MTAILLSLLEMTVTMSVVILLLFALSAVFGKKYKSRTRYIVWVIVLARLCIPLGVSLFPAVIEVEIPSQTAETEPITAETNAAEFDPPVYTIPNNTPLTPNITEEFTPVITSETNEIFEEPTPVQDEFVHETPSNDNIILWVTIIWLSGAAVFFLWRMIGYALVSLKLQKQLIPADSETDSLYRSLAERMNIRRVPPLRINRDIYSPMLCGFFKPVVILPAVPISQQSKVGILSHELTHYRRGDLWVKLICVLACAVNWFNPLVHMAASRCNREMELSCDESVLRGLDDKARVSYGKTMLEIIKQCGKSSPNLTTHFNPRKSAVRERFDGILDSTMKKRGVWVIVLAVVLCVLSGTWLACSFGNEDKAEDSVNIDSDHVSEESTKSESSADTQEIIDNNDNSDYSYLDDVLEYTAEDSTTTCSLLSDAAVESLNAGGRRDLTLDEINYIIDSSIKMYFAVDKVVFPSVMPIFEHLPTKEVSSYDRNGQPKTSVVPDFPYSENLAYYLLGEYNQQPIHDISDENLSLLYGSSDLNGDMVISSDEIEESKLMNRDSAVFEIKSMIGNIILYRILTFVDTGDLAVSEFTHSSGMVLQKFTYSIGDDTLVLDDGSGTFYLESTGEVIYPTAELEYDAILERENPADTLTLPENTRWHTYYLDNLIALTYDENHDSHLIYAPGSADSYEIALPKLRENNYSIQQPWGSTKLVDSLSTSDELTLWLNVSGNRYFRVIFTLIDGKLTADSAEQIDVQTLREETWLPEGEVTITDYKDLLPYAEAGFIYAYDFFFDLLSGESEIPEYNSVVIEDYTLRFTVPLTNYNIYFDYTITESGLDTMPVGEYHKIVRDSIDEYLIDVNETKDEEDPFADVKEVEMLRTFFVGNFIWNTPTFGEGVTYPGMSQFLCMYYGDNEILPLDEFKQLAAEKFGVTDFNALPLPGYVEEIDSVMAGSIGGTYNCTVEDVTTENGTTTVTVQFYADCNSLLKSHKVAYYFGENETWLGYEILERSDHAPYGMSYRADEVVSANTVVITTLEEIKTYYEQGVYSKYVYQFFYDFLSGKSDIPEYNSFVIEDFILRFTVPLTDNKISFDYTVKESALDTLPVGEYKTTVTDYRESYMRDDAGHFDKPNAYADVKEVQLLTRFLGAYHYWNTPTFGEETAHTGIHAFICDYYGGNSNLTVEEFERLAAEKFGITDISVLDIDPERISDGIIYGIPIGNTRKAFSIESCTKENGMASIVVQFYGDINYLLKSHKVAYYIGEDETWHGYTVLEEGKYEPCGMQFYEDKSEESGYSLNDILRSYMVGQNDMTEMLMDYPEFREEVCVIVNEILREYREGSDPLLLLSDPPLDCVTELPDGVAVPNDITSENVMDYCSFEDGENIVTLPLSDEYSMRIVWKIGLFGDSYQAYIRRFDIIKLTSDVPVYAVTVPIAWWETFEAGESFEMKEYTPSAVTELDGITLPIALNTDASRSELLIFHKITDISSDIFAVSGDIVAGGDPQSAYAFKRTADGGYTYAELPTLPQYIGRGVCKGVIIEPWTENGEERLSLMIPLTDGTVTRYRFDGFDWIQMGRMQSSHSPTYAKSIFLEGNIQCFAFASENIGYDGEPKVYISFDGGSTSYPYDIPLSSYYTYQTAYVVDFETTENGTFAIIYRLFRNDGSEFAVRYEAEIGSFTGYLQEIEPIGALSWYLYSSAEDSGQINITDVGLRSAAVVYSYKNGDIEKISDIVGGSGDYSEFDLSAAVTAPSYNIPIIRIEKLDAADADSYDGVREDGYFHLTYEYHNESYGSLTVTESEVFESEAGSAIYERVEYSTGDYYFEYHVRVSHDFLVKLTFSSTDLTESDCREIVNSLIFVNNSDLK